MDTTHDKNPFAFPPALMMELKAIADEQHRSVGDLVRAMVERVLEESRWKANAALDRQRANELGLPDDAQPMTEEYRQTIRTQIAQGVAAAHAGRLVDGDSVFARIKVEMAGLDRQEHG